MASPAPVPPRDPLLARILRNGAPPTPADDLLAAAPETSERILAAATEQVEHFGLRRFTLDDVARRLGVSRVTIYRYFPKRDSLVEAVLLREMHRFLCAVDAAVKPCETLEDKLVEGFVFALSYLHGHRLLSRLLRTEPELILPALTLRADRVLAAGREFIADFALREAERGALSLNETEIEATSELLARAVLSFVLTPDSVLGMRTDAEVRAFAEHYLAPILRTLSAVR
jgi:AcrR family transcriptional regulator